MKSSLFFPSRFVINDNNRRYPLDIIDLEWITTADRDSVEYFRGVTALVAVATSTNSIDAPKYIWCPCHDCHGHDGDVGCEEEEDQTCVDQMLRDGERFDTDDREYHKFTTRVKDSKTPVYNGCKAEHSKLQVVLSLLHLKASNGCFDRSFTELLELLKEILPMDNIFPQRVQSSAPPPRDQAAKKLALRKRKTN
jgi:hypothetical protein